MSLLQLPSKLQPVSHNLSATTCQPQPVSHNLSATTCLYSINITHLNEAEVFHPTPPTQKTMQRITWVTCPFYALIPSEYCYLMFTGQRPGTLTSHETWYPRLMLMWIIATMGKIAKKFYTFSLWGSLFLMSHNPAINPVSNKWWHTGRIASYPRGLIVAMVYVNCCKNRWFCRNCCTFSQNSTFWEVATQTCNTLQMEVSWLYK